MSKKRYVLFKPTHAGEVGPSDLSSIASFATVIDSVGRKAFLVEISEDELEGVRQRLDGWVIEEEQVHPHAKDDNE